MPLFLTGCPGSWPSSSSPVLFPYPWHIDKQQYKNAEWLSKGSAAEWFEQTEFDATKLANRIGYWMENRDALQDMATKAWQLGIRDSADRIVNIVEEVLEEKAA